MEYLGRYGNKLKRDSVSVQAEEPRKVLLVTIIYNRGLEDLQEHFRKT